ncbi:MAG TPA: putative quinol monooxygenase [Caulobacteraceae bacterium]|nr:putative quinol monooxygenase [Caulobacteraceae bacterium]
MTVIVAGTVRAPSENIERLRPHMLEMMTKTRAEDGCITYGYAEDVAEPGLIHVFEAWRDQAALEAHFTTPHMAAWRAVFPQFGVTDRNLKAYDVAAERPI